jgi:signal transduction histidine kinase
MAGVEDRPRALIVETERVDDGSVKLAVRDSGMGVNAHDVEKLFEAFYATKAQGIGIILSICRSIVESHDGRLWAATNDLAHVDGQAIGSRECVGLRSTGERVPLLGARPMSLSDTIQLQDLRSK